MENRHRPPVVPPSLQQLKRLIKQENLSSGRLSSLKLPRDLSLGGTKPKVYTPNLNVVRNKTKAKHVPAKTERGQKRARDKHAENGCSSRQKHKRVKYVQSEGVFSQGMGELRRTTHQTDKTVTAREHNNVASLVMPKIVRNSWNVNKTEDAAVINELVADEDSEEESDTDYDPVTLPFQLNKKSFMNTYKIKLEDPVSKIKKEEPDETSEGRMPLPFSNGFDSTTDIKPKMKAENSECTSEQQSAFLDSEKVYDDDNPAISVIQLPSSFSGKVWKDDTEDKTPDYTLAKMPEGQVGKIIVRKSGKMEVVIKNTKYQLVNNSETGNLSETANLSPGEQSIALEPSLVTLGNVSERLMLTPDWTNLFDRARKINKFYW